MLLATFDATVHFLLGSVFHCDDDFSALAQADVCPFVNLDVIRLV